MKKKEEIPNYLQAMYDFLEPPKKFDDIVLGKNDPSPEELMAKHQNVLNSPDRL